MNILKILREAAVPRRVLVKMNLTLDCSMIKATIGILPHEGIIDRTSQK